MTPSIHKSLTIEKWQSLPLEKRILNIASELTRSRNWAKEGRGVETNQSLERAIELTELTIDTLGRSQQNLSRELLRFKQALGGIYISDSKSFPKLQCLLKNLLDLFPAVHNLNLTI